MVVVSGSWVKNVATYPTPANNNDMVIPTTNNTMSAKAILICRPNSHPFQERTLTLDQPAKVGRSVARARATPTNAIFDCKVLSRHHALLWYDCGKFYLQDTKSSNGTFVNNNRLSSSDSEPHEVCSGDIVQFGVDVVENNRKVTHCCIVATLKLYLADGKEAKASPSITETSRHGLVPLDELYKLNQIIQEACQREQCLESKLSALQQVVEETRRSADESWQAYIGEERLLSRVATLESQLAQASKNITDDRLREELLKLQEERTSYQVAAKEALRKLHAERLDAVSAATEQERAKASAEQEASLAKEQLAQAQQELQEVAHKLMSEQKRSDEERAQLEQRERELQARLESETRVVNELQNKLEQFQTLVDNPVKELLPLEELEKCSLIYTDDMKSKEDMLAENETCENIVSDYTQANNRDEPEQNHINLRVAPVDEEESTTDGESDTTTSNESEPHESSRVSSVAFMREQTLVDAEHDGSEKEENEKEREHDSEAAKDDLDLHTQNGDDKDEEEYRDRSDMDKIDSKTLKYQFQSLQNELKKQIDKLQQQAIVNRSKISELETALNQEKQASFEKREECAILKREFGVLQQKWKESCNEILQMRDRIVDLNEQLITAESGLALATSSSASMDLSEKAVGTKQKIIGDSVELTDQKCLNSNSMGLNSAISNTTPLSEQIAALEEELVVLKERYSIVNDEKLALNKSLIVLQSQYHALCNRSYNTMFFYIAPLVLMVLYLLISQNFS